MSSPLSVFQVDFGVIALGLLVVATIFRKRLVKDGRALRRAWIAYGFFAALGVVAAATVLLFRIPAGPIEGPLGLAVAVVLMVAGFVLVAVCLFSLWRAARPRVVRFGETPDWDGSGCLPREKP